MAGVLQHARRELPPTPNVVNNVVLYDALFDVPNPKQTLMTQMTAASVLASAKEAMYVRSLPCTRWPKTGRAQKTSVRGGRASKAEPRAVSLPMAVSDRRTSEWRFKRA